jgi:predicted permease
MYTALFAKLIPLYLSVALGYIGKMTLNIDAGSISRLTIHVIGPPVIFIVLATGQYQASYLPLPILFTSVCFILAMMVMRFYPDHDAGTANLIAFAGGIANTGYFGLPLAFAVLPDGYAGTFFMICLHTTIYQFTYGYYILARGRYTAGDAFRRLVKLPLMWATAAGLVIGFMDLPLMDEIDPYLGDYKGAFTVLGMMIIGLTLPAPDHFRIDWRFLGWMIAIKYILWPMIMVGVITLDMLHLNLFDPIIYKILILIGILPMAASTSAFSAETGVHPDKASTAVLITTLISLALAMGLPWVFGIIE